MKLSSTLAALSFIAISTPVLGDVVFSSPAAGGSLASGTIAIKWKDSGDAPALADLSSYQLFLCAGGNENPVSPLRRRKIAYEEVMDDDDNASVRYMELSLR
jgi:hypothetical protein